MKGIQPGIFTRSVDNKSYAIAALDLLRQGIRFAKPVDLWAGVMNGQRKAHNGQADVVLALWEAGLLR